MGEIMKYFWEFLCCL